MNLKKLLCKIFNHVWSDPLHDYSGFDMNFNFICVLGCERCGEMRKTMVGSPMPDVSSQYSPIKKYENFKKTVV